MDRIRIIMASAEHTAVMAHIKKYNLVNCKPMNAKISKVACEQNCARAYLTKRCLKSKNERESFKARPLYACLQCKRYKKPTAARMAEVMYDNRINFGKQRKRHEQKQSGYSASSSQQGIITKLYDTINEISPLIYQESSAVESDKGEYGENAQSDDIFDRGIKVEIDEVC